MLVWLQRRPSARPALFVYSSFLNSLDEFQKTWLGPVKLLGFSLDVPNTTGVTSSHHRSAGVGSWQDPPTTQAPMESVEVWGFAGV